MPDDPTTPPTNDPTTPPPATPPAPADPPASGELGDAGKAALEAERRARRDAEKAAREAAAELETLRNASKTDNEKAIDQARRDGELVGTRRLVEAEIRAAAAGKMANPAIAARLLDVDGLMPKDGGEVDGERIAEAITELLAREPYLAVTPGAPAGEPTPPPKAPPAGSAPGGARGTAPGIGTFTRSQLRDPAFFQANKAEILKAAADGRITDD